MKKVLLFIFLGFFSFGVIMAQNILLNGDLEGWDDVNTPTGWAFANGITQETTIIHGGSSSAKHEGGKENLAQTVAVTPGVAYKISLWYYVESGDGTDARIWSYWKNSGTSLGDNADELRGPNNSYFKTDLKNPAWAKYEVILVAPATANELYFEVRIYSGAVVYWDDLVVEPYVSTGSIDLTAPNSGSYTNNGDVVNITWTSSEVDSVLLYARMEDLAEPFLITEESAILASLRAFDLPIPMDAEEGNYKFIIVDKDDPTVADSSDNFIFVKDVLFAGLDDYPFSPENGATGVPTDLFTGRLEMHFRERVQTNTGNIYLKKFSDNSVVETFDVTDPSQVVVDTEEGYNVNIYISSDLDPDTKYYVEVEAGAIIDRAGTPNEFAGFTGNSTWSFTTGSGASYVSIYNIQYTTDSSGDSPYIGNTVRTEGIVMAKTKYGYYLQEGSADWSGIFVYDSNNSGIVVGDELRIGGTVDEYKNFTQIKDIIFKTVLSSGNTLYAPVTIGLSQLGEPYESVLVMVETISCSNPDLGHGEWEITDQTTTDIVDDLFYAYTPQQDEEFTSVTGILNYSYGAFKLEPRDADDIVAVPTRIRNVDNAGFGVGPNPVGNEIRISADKPIADVQVVNVVGEVMDVEFGGASSNVIVATEGLANGLYLVKVTFTDGTVRIQKVIKR